MSIMLRNVVESLKWLMAPLLISASSFGDVLPEPKHESTDRVHHLGLLLGTGIGSYREDLVVPVSFDGPVFVFGGKYSAQTVRTSLQVNFGISVALLKNRFSHKAYALALDLRPSWAKAIWSNGTGRQIRCGVALPLQMRNLFWESWDDAHLYWLTTHSIAAIGEYHTPLPYLGNSVIRIDFPLMGFVSRPPEYRYQKQEPLNHLSYHFSAPNRSFVFKGIWEYQSPMLQILVTRGSKGSLMNVGFDLELDHSSEPKDVWILSTRLLFSYQWRIG